MNGVKYGYLEFRYGHDARRSSVNLGDNIQSLAVRALFGQLGIPAERIVGIDRDSLRDYAGEPIKVIMNGCLHDDCFPLSDRIEPVFFGFNAETESVVTRNKALLLKHQPIGCRDTATRRLLEKHGIQAFVTGCATFTFHNRDATPAGARPVIAFGQGSGVLPPALLNKIPKPLLEQARLVYQREAVARLPLDTTEVARMEDLANGYLDIYRNQASVVITPLLHVASPCLAMGVPVILARRDRDERFSAIDRLLPVYTPANFDAIDWNPSRPDMDALKTAMLRTADSLLRGSMPGEQDRALLAGTFDAEPILPEPAPTSFLHRLRRRLAGGRAGA
jgi:hypothetical protein